MRENGAGCSFFGVYSASEFSRNCGLRESWTKLHVGGSRKAGGVPPKGGVGESSFPPSGKVATRKLIEEKTLKISRQCGRENQQPFLLRCFGGLGVSPNSKRLAGVYVQVGVVMLFAYC